MVGQPEGMWKSGYRPGLWLDLQSAGEAKSMVRRLPTRAESRITNSPYKFALRPVLGFWLSGKFRGFML
jgi:hypothetical protein